MPPPLASHLLTDCVVTPTCLTPVGRGGISTYRAPTQQLPVSSRMGENCRIRQRSEASTPALKSQTRTDAPPTASRSGGHRSMAMLVATTLLFLGHLPSTTEAFSLVTQRQLVRAPPPSPPPPRPALPSCFARSLLPRSLAHFTPTPSSLRLSPRFSFRLSSLLFPCPLSLHSLTHSTHTLSVPPSSLHPPPSPGP